MIDFTPLVDILNMDLSQLRANSGRATDDAILLLVTKLNEFFAQFEINPTPEEQGVFDKVMGEIIQKINMVEKDYFKQKYINDPEMKDIDLNLYTIQSYKALPELMQYFAAGEKFGDTIRNPSEHIKAITSLQKWPNIKKELSAVPKTLNIMPNHPFCFFPSISTTQSNTDKIIPKSLFK